MKKEKILITIDLRASGLFWTVSKELSGNDEDDVCGPFLSLGACLYDLVVFKKEADLDSNLATIEN